MKTIRSRGISSILQLNDEPNIVAKGFALGSFIGMLPFPGFQVLISVILATLLKYNKAAAITAVFNTNLVTGVFIFAFNYWLGRNILGLDPNFTMPDKINLSFAKTIVEAGSDVFLSLLLGGCITGTAMMIATYQISLMILKKRKIKNQK